MTICFDIGADKNSNAINALSSKGAVLPGCNETENNAKKKYEHYLITNACIRFAIPMFAWHCTMALQCSAVFTLVDSSKYIIKYLRPSSTYISNALEISHLHYS